MCMYVYNSVPIPHLSQQLGTPLLVTFHSQLVAHWLYFISANYWVAHWYLTQLLSGPLVTLHLTTGWPTGYTYSHSTTGWPTGYTSTQLYTGLPNGYTSSHSTYTMVTLHLEKLLSTPPSAAELQTTSSWYTETGDQMSNVVW